MNTTSEKSQHTSVPQPKPYIETSGPWHVMNSHIKDGKTIYRSRNDLGDQGVDFLADIPPFIGNDKVADLISAAPDLLQACKAALKCLCMDSDSEEDYAPEISQLRTAITKATTL